MAGDYRKAGKYFPRQSILNIKEKDTKSMKITFVYPDIYPDYLDWPGGFYFGIGSLAAILKQAGHKTSLVHVVKRIQKSDLIKRIEIEDPDLIGFSSTSHHVSYIRQWAAWLAESKKRIPAIYGGIHPTILPEESIAMEGVDIICRGEGEAPLTELCHRLENKEDISDIPNLWVKNNGKIRRNHLRNLTEDLDKLPFPDRHIFDYPNLYDEREGMAVFLASRGCPFSCTYCCNHLLRKIYGKGSKTVRFRSVDSIIEEIKQVLNDHPFIEQINFHDDILFLRKKWGEEFTEKYRSQIKLPFICNVRADITDGDIVNLLKEAGCSHVKFGLESGNAEIRFKVLNRQMTNDQIKNASALCRLAGLKTLSYNMVGLPNETPSDILDTIKLNATIGVDYTHATIYQPYRGTELGELCREQDYLESESLGPSFYALTPLKLNMLSPSQVLMFQGYFRVLTRYYQMLQKLPPTISKISIRSSDKILSLDLTAKILNFIFIPFNHLFIRLKLLKLKLRLARRKASVELQPRELQSGKS
jgi:radical SAM superfamily enzyme YgiQ (UPF0313 family)